MKVFRFLYPLTALLGSFLLFALQPAIGKALLPHYGGSFMVWAVVVSFFQGTLLLGYLLAHILFGKKVTLSGTLIFIALLGVGLFVFKFRISDWTNHTVKSGFLSSEIILLLQTIFLPALLLSTNSVVLQRFWSSTPAFFGEAPFFLFSASNIGSVLGILAVPFFLEYYFPLGFQLSYFTIIFRLWIVSMIFCIPWRPQEEIFLFDDQIEETPLGMRTWLVPATASSALLISTTNVLTLDVAGFPMIWILPLLLYIISFVRTFRGECPEEPPWYLESLPYLLATTFSLAVLNILGFAIPVPIKIFFHLLLLYFLCMAAHLVLYSRKPFKSVNLTKFYLTIALGGWLGSVLVVFVIPRIFNGLAEFPISLFLIAWAIWDEKFWKLDSSDTFFPVRAFGVFLIVFFVPTILGRGMPETENFFTSAVAGVVFYLFSTFKDLHLRGLNRVQLTGCITMSLLLLDQYGTSSGTLQHSSRTCYGTYKVYDSKEIRHLMMGSTFHGHEALSGESAGKPVMYYHPTTPIGEFLENSRNRWKRMAVMGLGAGTIAGYGREKQEIDFFEIDPEMERIARDWFSFLKNSKAQIKIIHGDGRLQLRKAPPGYYDLLIMDAFSSDSIPTHLLTTEAIQEYLEVLNKTGLILFHISNRHLFLTPVLKAAAQALKLEIRTTENPEPNEKLALPTGWVAIGNPQGIDKFLRDLPKWEYPAGLSLEVKPWTDQFANLFLVLRWN